MREKAEILKTLHDAKNGVEQERIAVMAILDVCLDIRDLLSDKQKEV